VSSKPLGLLLYIAQKIILNFKLKAAVLVIAVNSIFSLGLKVKNEVILNISPVKTPFSLFNLYDNPIVNLFEGINGEIIVARGSFLEVFDKNGRFLKRVGNLGEGPGDFKNIIFLKKYQNEYYILDFPNLLNIFDAKFKFRKRFYLQGKRNSPFVFDFEISGNYIIAAQFWRTFMGEEKKENKDKVISIYDLNGKFQKAIFNFSNALNLLGDEAYLNPNICTFDDLICVTFAALNKIWIIDKEGQLIKVKTFGINSWRKIPYSSEREEQLRKRGFDQAKILAWFLTSGDWVYDVSFYRGYILINALRNKETQDMNLGVSYIYILDKNLQNINSLIFLDKYFLGGVGRKFLYFVRYLQVPSARAKTKIEVKKCVLERF